MLDFFVDGTEEMVLNPAATPEPLRGWRRYRLEYGGCNEDCILEVGPVYLPPDADLEELLRWINDRVWAPSEHECMAAADHNYELYRKAWDENAVLREQLDKSTSKCQKLQAFLSRAEKVIEAAKEAVLLIDSDWSYESVMDMVSILGAALLEWEGPMTDAEGEER